MTIEKYRPAVGKFNIGIDKLLQIFAKYGQDVYIPHTEIEIEKLAMTLHRELTVVDKETL